MGGPIALWTMDYNGFCDVRCGPLQRLAWLKAVSHNGTCSRPSDVAGKSFQENDFKIDYLFYTTNTVGTPYNTNVGVQKIPDRAIWKPMVAKRNNTNPWSWLRPQILVAQDSGQSHMSKQPASRDWPEQIAPLVHSSQTAWQLFNLGQSIEIRIPHLLGHVGQLHTKCISHIWLRFSVL